MADGGDAANPKGGPLVRDEIGEVRVVERAFRWQERISDRRSKGGADETRHTGDALRCIVSEHELRRGARAVRQVEALVYTRRRTSRSSMPSSSNNPRL